MCETNGGEAVKGGEAVDGEVLRTCSVAVHGSAAPRVSVTPFHLAVGFPPTFSTQI